MSDPGMPPESRDDEPPPDDSNPPEDDGGTDGVDCLGAMERRNPLPQGIYWIDVFTPHVRDFQGWMKEHRDTVHAKESSTYSDPEGVFVKFEVTSPTPWNGPGYPTISSQAQTQADTSSAAVATDYVRANPVTSAVDPYIDTAAAKSVAKDVASVLPSPLTIAAVLGVVLAVALMVLKRVP